MKRKIAFILAALLTASSFSACSSGNSESVSESSTSSTAASSSQSTESTVSTEGTTGNGMPITTEDLTLTWYVPLYNTNVLQSANDQYCWQQIQKNTGIKIDFIHPPTGTGNDALNIRIASNDLTDVITNQWIFFPGGPGKAISDDIIIDLREHSEYMPYYTEMIDSIPTAGPNSVLDDGAIYGFIHAVPDPIINATGGFRCV